MTAAYDASSQWRDARAALVTTLRQGLAYAALFSVFANLMLLAPTLYMLQVFDRVLTSRSTATLLMLSVGVGIALMAMSVVDLARSRLLISLGRHVDSGLGKSVLSLVISQVGGPIARAPTVGLKDVATLRAFFSGANVIALFDAPWLVVYLALIFAFHPALGLAALTGMFLLVTFVFATERANRRAATAVAGLQRQSTGLIDQGLRQADVLTAMGMVTAFSQRWDQLNLRTQDELQSRSRRGGALLAASKFLRQAVQVVMMGLGAWLVIESHVTPGVMMAATILYGRAMAPVEALIANWGGLVAARMAYQRLNALTVSSANLGGRTKMPVPVGRLSADALSLSFAGVERPLLSQISFDLPAGASLGVLGASGVGKSSLGKLLVGAWVPSTGTVKIDGVDLALWPSEALGPHLGYLPQGLELFQGTVAENIGRFTAGADGEIIDACRRAHALDMILKLPKGLDTWLGEGGVRLSGGQAQRIGLARALFGRPKLVVLDEPDANLDAAGEQALWLTLDMMKEQKTTVVAICHRAALINRLDYLLVLDGGSVVLSGPRESVLQAMKKGAAAPSGRSLSKVEA